MWRSLTLRLLLAALCVGGTQAMVLSFRQQSAAEASQASSFDLAQLPLTCGTWTGETMEFDSRLFQRVGALKLLERKYTSPEGRQVSLHLALFPTAQATIPHIPELCYAGTGWSIVNNDWRKGEKGNRYRLMSAVKNDEAVNVIYWYQLGNEVVATRDELRLALQKFRLQGKRWPPFVKVLIQASDTVSPQARTSLDDFTDEVYRWIAENS